MIYLCRHGEALSSQQDPNRALSAGGVADVQRMATFLSNEGAIRPAQVMHSGVLRAMQTADILAETVAPSLTPQKLDGLHPMDPTETMALAIRSWDEPTLLVGHNPFMEALTARLLTGDENGALLAFEPGTIAALAPITQDRSRFALLWFVTPSLLG